MLQPKVGQTVPMLVEPAALPEAAVEMIARSKDFGEAFAIGSPIRTHHVAIC